MAGDTFNNRLFPENRCVHTSVIPRAIAEASTALL